MITLKIPPNDVAGRVRSLKERWEFASPKKARHGAGL
jgi:hypothetical protein